MINRRFPIAIALSLLGLVAVSSAPAQETASAHVIVTASPKKGAQAMVQPSSISVSIGRKPQQVTSFVSLREAPLQIAILLDNASRASMSLQLGDIRNFMMSLPPNAEVTVGYMQNGMPNLAGPFTTNHAAAAQALRIPLGIGGINGSPYFCLQDLIKHWQLPVGPDVRREVLMVTDGIDRYSGLRYNPDNPYVQAAINDAQKAGIVIYSIFYTGAGRFDRRGWADYGGQNYLIQLSGDTGGQAYYQGFGNPVSFRPFLNDLRQKLNDQYDLAFTAPPKKGLQTIKVKTNQPGISLETQSLVQLMK